MLICTEDAQLIAEQGEEKRKGTSIMGKSASGARTTRRRWGEYVDTIPRPLLFHDNGGHVAFLKVNDEPSIGTDDDERSGSAILMPATKSS